MGRNASYWSRNLLWSLLILQPKFVAVGFFFSQTFHLSIILASLAVSQSPIMTFLIPMSSCTQSPSFPASGQSPAASGYPVSPFRLFWYFGLFSLPILTELMFSWMSCKDRRPGFWAKRDGPLKGETKWGAVRFAPKMAKRLAEKLCCVAALSHVMASSMHLYIWSAQKCV